MRERIEALRTEFRLKWVLLTSVVFAFWFLGYLFNKGFGLYLDPSVNRCMPEVFYVGYPSNKPVASGDLVSFVSQGDYMAGLFGGKRVVKRVAAIEGDFIEDDGEQIFINGSLVEPRNPGVIERMSARGIDLKPFTGVVPPGKVYLMGSLERSFDSRYWGLLDLSVVDKKAIGVF